MKADYVETCNCDYGRPCSDLRVMSGSSFDSYQIWKLPGLTVYISSLPKAIHEGNGTAQYFITNKANEEQRHVLINICSGQAKESGHFALFAGTFKYFFEPQFKVNLDGKRSSFSVPGIIDVQTESFTNPVTGEVEASMTEDNIKEHE